MATVEWVRQRRAAGKHDEEIIVELIGTGWVRDDAISLLRDATIEEHHEKLSRSEFLPLLIGLFGIVVFIAALITNRWHSLNAWATPRPFEIEIPYLIVVAVILAPLWILYHIGIRNDKHHGRKMFLLYASLIGSVGSGALVLLGILLVVILTDMVIGTTIALLLFTLVFGIIIFLFQHQHQLLLHHFYARTPRATGRAIVETVAVSIVFLLLLTAAVYYSEKETHSRIQSNVENTLVEWGDHPQAEFAEGIDNYLLLQKLEILEGERDELRARIDKGYPEFTLVSMLDDSIWKESCEISIAAVEYGVVAGYGIAISERYRQFKQANFTNTSGYDALYSSEAESSQSSGTSMISMMEGGNTIMRIYAPTRDLSTCVIDLGTYIAEFSNEQKSLYYGLDLKNPEERELAAFIMWQRRKETTP